MVRLLIIGVYIASSFMVHGDGETGLKNLKETLKDLDYTNKLMKGSMDDQNIN